jgi:hypothetical protein
MQSEHKITVESRDQPSLPRFDCCRLACFGAIISLHPQNVEIAAGRPAPHSLIMPVHANATHSGLGSCFLSAVVMAT